MPTSLWFKDAVIYELPIEIFHDLGGSGDFRGLIEWLDHFTELGVTVLWLPPLPPALRHDGSSMDDLRTLLDDAHQRGLRVITALAMPEDLRAVIDFWFGLGMDGVSLEAGPDLNESEPVSGDSFSALRQHLDETFPDRLLLVAESRWRENAGALDYVRRHGGEPVLVLANRAPFDPAAEIETTPAVLSHAPQGCYRLLPRAPSAGEIREAAWIAPEVAGAGVWNDELTSHLEGEILPVYVPTCRWFGGKGRVLRELKITHNVAIGALQESRLLVIEMVFLDGPPESYVLPLSIVGEAMAQAVGAATPHVILARFEDGRVLCDAIHVPEARAELLQLITHPTADGAQSRLAGTSRGPFDVAMLERARAQSRVVGADQSNTAVIYGDAWFMKLFRKFEHGPNPDVEVTHFLSEARGFPHVPPYFGALRLSDPAGEGVIALLAGFTPNQGDGWTFTLDALASYFVRVLASRAEFTPAALGGMLGGVYPARARQLGQRSAEMHLALASGEDRPEFAAEPFTPLDQRSLHDEMCGSARRVLQQLRRQAGRLPPAIRADATEIAANQSRTFTSFGRLLSREIAAGKIRTHGDYHLGQVLNTGDDFVLLDFEGEPRLSLRERLLKRSPLRDVAGMLRSFDYAGSAALRLQKAADLPCLAPWARAWVDAVSGQFLESYFATAGGASFLPANPADVTLLLEVFMLDKAFYEIGYELSYRPDFLAIPTGAVRRLLAEKGGADSEQRREGT